MRLRQSQASQVGSNQEDSLTFLQSSSDEEVVHQVRVSDTGSITQCVKLFIQGVPVYGIIDSGADITIIGGKLFASAARLKKNFMKPDKTPRTYDQKPFTLDGRMDLDVMFEDMQKSGIIQPSKSPWSSPVVMVRKRDGTHRFCVDYCKLNTVTKADTFPLPRIDDLLDQLGQAKYFSLVDLASGYW